MPGDNAAKMTLEEKLVQSIKKTQLATLVDDEDAITELTKRAIREALFQPIRRHDGYRHYEEDSLIVNAAKSIAKEYIAAVTKDIVKQMSENVEIMEAIRRALMLALPDVLRGSTHSLFLNATNEGAMLAVETLRKANLVPPTIAVELK